MAKVKCRYCGKSIDKSNAIREEYLQVKALKIANRYFCSQECFDEYHFEDKIKSQFYDVSSELLEIDSLKNTYFKKRLSEMSDITKAFLIIEKKKKDIISEFKTEIKKIKDKKSISKNYEIVVYINMLETYIKEFINTEVENNNERIILDNYIDYESVMPKGKQAIKRKTIFDMEE